MKIILLRILLNINLIVQIICSKQVSEIENTKLEKEVLKSAENYNVDANRAFTIKLGNITSNPYAINLQLKDEKTDQFIDHNTNSSFGDENGGCRSLQPSFFLKQTRKAKLQQRGQSVFYSDLQQIYYQNIMFLVLLTSDYNILFLQQRYGTFDIVQNVSFSEKLILQGDKEKQAFFRSNGEDHYIFTADGTLRVNFSLVEKSIITCEFELQTQVLPNQGIKDVFIYQNKVYFARGDDSLRVFEIQEDKTLIQTKLLSFMDFQMSQDQIPIVVQVKYDEGQQFIYVLEEQTGLHIFDSRDFPKNHIMNIPIAHGFSFDYIGSTFLIAGREQNQDYLVEVIVNLNKKEYYINQELSDEVTINGMLILNNIAIIASDDMQLIQYHSIYRKLIPSHLDITTQYDGENFKILRPYILENNTLSDSKFFVLKPYEILEYQIMIMGPQIKCFSPNSLSQQYKVDIYQRDCMNKKINLDNSITTTCELSQTFDINFQGRDEGFTTQQIVVIAIGIIIACILIVILIIKLRQSNQEIKQSQTELIKYEITKISNEDIENL